MRLRMRQDCPGSPDGIHVVHYAAGEEYDFPEELAERFLAREVAEDPDAEPWRPEEPEREPAEAEEPEGEEPSAPVDSRTAPRAARRAGRGR